MQKKKQPITEFRSEPLTARELILALIDSTRSDSLSARYFVAAGAVFQMDPGSIRVALARLVRDGSLQGYQRGRYRLGNRAGTLQHLVRNWSKIEDSLKPWAGGWLTVFVGHLARANKTRVRSNERALNLFGFAEVQSGLWVRPDNLVMAPSPLREALLQLGLDEQCPLAEVSDLQPVAFVQPPELWDINALEARYRSHIDTLAQSSRSLTEQDQSAGARETLLIGRQITRDILLDPLLPDALINASLRRQMVNAMRDYDTVGKSIWRKFFEQHEAAPNQKPAA